MFSKKVFKFSTLSISLFLGILISFNVCYADGLVINEIVASDAYGGTDWIEFYVVGSSSVYLGDYSIVDAKLVLRILCHVPATK